MDFYIFFIGFSVYGQEISDYKWNVKKFARTINGKTDQVMTYDRDGSILTYLEISDIGYSFDTGWVSVNDSDYYVYDHNLSKLFNKEKINL